MPNAEKINLLDQQYPQLKSVNNTAVPALEKVKHIETEHSDGNFLLLRKFLKDLQASNDNFIRMYNSEVI